MTIYEFMTFLKPFEPLDYEIEFVLGDDDGGSTFVIKNINEFGAVLNENIGKWRLLNDEYRIHLVKVKAKVRV